MLQFFPHVVFFATSRGKFFYLAREIIFAIFAFLTISTKLLLKFYYTLSPFRKAAQYRNHTYASYRIEKKEHITQIGH